MSDFLLDLSENPQARKLIKTLGLPLPMPEKLDRAAGPYEERPIDGRTVVVGGAGALTKALAESLVRAGAEPVVVGDDALVGHFRRAGEAWGRPVRTLAAGATLEGGAPHALVFDATGITKVAGTRALFEFLQPHVRGLAKSGRVVVLGRPPEDGDDPEASAASAGLEGFTRSVAKEIGKKGATANLVYVAEGAEGRVSPVLRFLLSPRSAYVTAQPIRVNRLVKGDESFPTTRPLEGKVVLLTGAARGIGEATAEIMAAEGAHVVCLDRPADDGPLSQVARRIGGSVLLADITDPGAPETIAKALKERHGGVDVVVHNAGVTRDKMLANMKPELWEQAVDINLGAVVRITSRLLKDKVLRDNARVVFLSSVSGIAGNAGQTNYATGKSGLVGYLRHLSPELADRGIAVNAVAPGFIETRMTAAMPVVIREAARRLSALGQGGLPEDVGQAITFLSTPGALGLTGNVIRVCGGALVGA